MTPYAFGQLVKQAVETGGFGEYLGQGFDRGVRRFNAAVGMPNLSPQAFGGGQAQAPATSRVMPGPSASTVDPAMLAPPPAPRPQQPARPRVMPGPSASTVDPAMLAPAPAPTPAPAQPARVMPGASRATHSPPPPKPRPSGVKPAPARPKPTAPGVRTSQDRVA